MLRQLLVICFAFCFSVTASAQLGKIPVAVTEAFSKQYPNAREISYSDNLSDYSVHFTSDSIKWIARYNSKGVWKGSEKTVSFNELSAEVKDGFAKSKYSEWKIRDVSILILPETAGGGEQYRLKVSNGELNKKALYFNKIGRLVRDNVYL